MAQERRPRRTNAQVEAAIKQATFAELLEAGYQNLTFEKVAQRAEVSKHVLYRRYANRNELVLDTMREQIHQIYAPAPSKGNLREDILAWFSFAESNISPLASATARGVLGEASPEQVAGMLGVISQLIESFQESIVAPSIERGEIPGPVPDTVVEVFFRTYRDCVVFGAFEESNLEALVDTVFLPLFTGLPTRQNVSNAKK